MLARIRALVVERALVIALRLACDLDASQPAWARSLAARLPDGTPLLTRLVYPDLSAGRRPSAVGLRIRQLLYRPVPGLNLRPSRVAETLLPRFAVRAQGPPRVGTRLGRLIRWLALLGANLVALADWKLRGDRRKRSGGS